jgi:excisionase family DNA binding protein
MPDTQVARRLNEENVPSAKGKPFTRTIVSWVRYRYDIPAPCLKGPDELTVGEVANRLGVRPGVVYYWIEHGHLSARRLQVGSPYWITLGAEKESELRAWVASSNRIKSSETKNITASGAI